MMDVPCTRFITSHRVRTTLPLSSSYKIPSVDQATEDMQTRGHGDASIVYQDMAW